MDFLETLKIDTLNKGVSTGSNWLDAKGETIDSFSLLMAKKLVRSLPQIKKAMKQLSKKQKKLLKNGGYGLLPKEVKWFAR